VNKVAYWILIIFSVLLLKRGAEAQQPYSTSLVINAAAGDPDAKADLAQCYLFGKGVEKNINTGVQLLKEAAESNQTTALFLLGLMNYNGENVKQDPKKAEQYLLKAANNGFAPAQMLLGDFYQRGFKNEFFEISPDKKKSDYWFKEAEKQGLYSKNRVDNGQTQTPAGVPVFNLSPETIEVDTKRIEEAFSKEIENIKNEGTAEIQNELNRATDKIATEAEELKKQAAEKILESEKRNILKETVKPQ